LRLCPGTDAQKKKIIFLTVVFGLAMLILNKKILVIVQFVGQANWIWLMKK